MPRKIAIVVLLFWQSTLLSVPLGVQFGLGFSRSNRPGDTATGLVGGLCTDIPLFPWFGFAPEARLWVPSGNVSYLSLPLLLRASVDLSHQFAFQFLAGPDVAFRITGPTFKDVNFWLVTGVGVYAHASENLGLRLSLQHAFGMVDFTTAAGGDDRLHYLLLVLGAYFEF